MKLSIVVMIAILLTACTLPTTATCADGDVRKKLVSIGEKSPLEACNNGKWIRQ